MPLEDEPIWANARSCYREGGWKAACLGKELLKEKLFFRYQRVAAGIATTGMTESQADRQKYRPGN